MEKGERSERTVNERNDFPPLVYSIIIYKYLMFKRSGPTPRGVGVQQAVHVTCKGNKPSTIMLLTYLQVLVIA